MVWTGSNQKLLLTENSMLRQCAMFPYTKNTSNKRLMKLEETFSQLPDES